MKTIAYHSLVLSLFLLFGYANIYSQIITNSTTQIDSPIVELKEYKVLAYQQFEFSAGIRTSQLNSSLIKYNQSFSSLSDALLQIGPVYMRSYGNSMNNAITIRGFGPERTGILWNGININNAGLGQLDMNLMTAGFFNSIQIIEGSSSTQYGSGALGGSILLEFKPDFTNVFNIKLQQEFGSFFTWNTFSEINYGGKSIQGRTSFIRNSSLNNYPYKDLTTIGSPVRETVNANFYSYQGIQDIFFKLKRNWHISLHGWYNYTNRNIPPAMGAVNNHSQQIDENLRIMTQIRKTFSHHDVQFQMAYIHDNLIFNTDAFKDSTSIHTAQLQTQYIYHPKKLITLMVGGNLQFNYSDYKYYQDPVTEFRGNIFVLSNFAINHDVKISVGIRQQFSSHYTSYPSAHAGINHVLKSIGPHKISYKFGVNSAYRMPTLNDLYWVPGGNPNVRPEYSWNIENSWMYVYQTSKSILSCEVLGYFGRTIDWIQWTPTTMGYWAPQNITNVQSAGSEAGFGYTCKNKKWEFQFKSSYTFTHATDMTQSFHQLIYVPQHSIKSFIELKWNRIYLQIIPNFTSQRYTLSDNSQFIPSMFLLNINAGYHLQIKTWSIGLVGRIGNVTNADYQMVVNRPMPGIHFNIGINFYLHIKSNKANNK